MSASVKLVFPPQWTPQNPPFALYSLAGHLRSRGIAVSPVDLNLLFYERVLTPEYLHYSKDLALLRRGHLAGKSFFQMAAGDSSEEVRLEAAHLLELDRCFKTRPDPWETTAGLVLQAVSTLRDQQRFYDPASLISALIAIDNALYLASIPYFPSRLTLNDYRNPLFHLTMQDIVRLTKDRRNNLFINYYEEILPELFSDSPPVIAVSINSFSQVLPGLTLVRMLRENLGDSCHITVGGNFFGRIKEKLREHSEFFTLFCHSLSFGEGEEILAALARCIESGDSLEQVPRLLYLDALGAVRSTQDEGKLSMDEIGFMDLDGLDLRGYLTPYPVVCIQYSRGCYWAKCSFCDSYFGRKLDKKSLDRFIAEVFYLKKRYGITHYEFIDECIRPDEMKSLAERLTREGAGISWFANARTEAGFTPEVFRSLKRSGLTMLLWGVESGCERVMKLIQKGISTRKRTEILHHARETGIWNFAYVFFGFPSETKEEAMETIGMICENTDTINSYGRSIFTLGKHAPLRSKAEKLGIVDVVEDDQELSTNLFYKVTKGMSRQEVEEIAGVCTKMCHKAYDSPLWMALRNRENLHLYLARYGPSKVARTKAPSPQELLLIKGEELIQFQK